MFNKPHKILVKNEVEIMEVQTPKEFFEKSLPERFKPEKAAGIDVIVQLSLNGANGGDWVVNIKDQKIAMREGTDPSATLTLKATDKDFMDIVNRKISAEKAFFTGRIHFKGNLSLALKLREAGIL
jgi:putative sterol carrier protein